MTQSWSTEQIIAHAIGNRMLASWPPTFDNGRRNRQSWPFSPLNSLLIINTKTIQAHHESCTRSKGKPVAEKYKVAQIQQHQVLLGCHFRSCCISWCYYAQCLKICLLLFMENKRRGDLVDLGIMQYLMLCAVLKKLTSISLSVIIILYRDLEWAL